VIITRRRALWGIAAVAAVGVGVALEEERDDRRVRRVLHRLGFVHSPDHHVADADVPQESGTFASAAMGRPVAWTIAVPPGAIQGVMYCLHARNGDHRMAFDEIQLPDVAAAVGVPFAVAAVDGGDDSYWHARASGIDPLAMFLDEFIPMVESRIGPQENRALLGWSMGGYGALLAAERAPDRFKVVAASSPALWTRAADTAPGAFDSAADFREHDVFSGVDRLAPLVVRVDCGSDDPFYDASKEFVARLPGRPYGSFGQGFHDAAYWRTVAPEQVKTIAGAFSS
jgi:pimeloyl-ACP methyl ester carboxylesterase